MATIIDELFIKLGIDGKAATAGANQVKASMDGIAKTAQGLMKTFAGVGMALTGAFAAGQFFSDWKTKAIEFQNIARSVGKSMEEVQAYAGALGKYGGSVESFTSAFRSLNGELIKISTTGSSRAGKILGELGIDVGEVGRMRDADAVLGDIADVMSKMSMAEATGLGTKIGFDASMVQLLHEGRDGFKDLIEQKKRDAVYTEEDAQTVREYNAAQKQLSIGFARIANVIFRTIVPAFTYITRVIGDFVKEMSKHQIAIKAFVIMLGALITAYLMPTIAAFFASLLTNPITWVIVALAGLALMIEDLVVWANNGESAFPALWAAIFGSPEEAQQTWGELMAFFEDLGKRLSSVWNDFRSNTELVEIVLMTLAGVIMTVALVALAELAAAILANPITWYIAAIMALVAVFLYWDEIVDWVCDAINSALNGLFEWINEQFDALESFAGSVTNGIGAFFIDLGNTIMSAIGSAIDWALGKLAELAAAIKSTPIIGDAISLGMSAWDAITGGGGGSSNNSVSTKVNTVNVYTQATDAHGMANDMRPAIHNAFANYQQANGGVS